MPTRLRQQLFLFSRPLPLGGSPGRAGPREPPATRRGASEAPRVGVAAVLRLLRLHVARIAAALRRSAHLDLAQQRTRGQAGRQEGKGEES